MEYRIQPTEYRQNRECPAMSLAMHPTWANSSQFAKMRQAPPLVGPSVGIFQRPLLEAQLASLCPHYTDSLSSSQSAVLPSRT
jgi:hypothetical protein